MKKSLLSLAIAAIAAGMLSSCVNELEVPKTEKELNEFINSQFDYNTWKKVSVRMEMGTRALIPVYTYDPTTTSEAEPIFSVVTDRNGNFSGRIELGGAMMGKDLYAVCEGTVIKARVDKNGVVFRNTSRSITDYGEVKPEGIVGICDKLSNSFHAQLPAGIDNTKKVQQRMQDIEIHVNSDYTTVTLSWIDYGDDFPVVAYYYYYHNKDGNGQPITLKDAYTPYQFVQHFINNEFYNYLLTPYEIVEGKVVPTPVTQYYNGHMGTTITLQSERDSAPGATLPFFSADTSIGVVLKVGDHLLFPGELGAVEFSTITESTEWKNVSGIGFHAGAYSNDPKDAAFDDITWPTEITPEIPSEVLGEQYQPNNLTAIVYGYEDNGFGGSDKDYDDVMFVMFANGLIGDNIPSSIEGYFGHKGTYLFEDLYPTAGDYDMNDVVVDYRYDVYYNTVSGKVTSFDWEISPRWDGASYTNDFYLSYSTPEDGTVSSELIYQNNKKVAQKKVFSGHAYIDENGVKQGDEFAKGLLGRAADENLFRFTYGNPVLNYGINPYIYCNNTKRQVHLPKFTFDYFPGVGETEADKALGVYVLNDYNGGNGYPFAMDLSRDNKDPNWKFDIVTESKHIFTEYKNFSNWVIYHETSDEYNDWYDHKDR